MLSLYNSLTREIEPFNPRTKDEVTMFTCGPSIYQRPHIGNYRTYLFEDILQRYLEYLGYRVTRVLNYTDIEDKSIQEAEKRHMDVLEMTEQCRQVFVRDLDLLKIKAPTYAPRSSTSVDQAVMLIQKLLDKSYAYWYRGNVYFDLLKFGDFGKLGHLDRWPRIKRRYHKDTYPGNYRNVGDFILWHGYRKGDTVYWDTAIGRGRPAWNVQDPAMTVQTLGYSCDICCGGEDNLVRHHDYTIAVMESISQRPPANFWLHGAHLLVDGKKMSKSKGNMLYPDDLLKAGYTPDEIRFFLIYGKYRKRMNFTFDRMAQTTEKLRRTRDMIRGIGQAAPGRESHWDVKAVTKIKRDFEMSMDNDLDVKRTFDDLDRTLSKLTRLVHRNLVSSRDGEHIISELTDIDTVLQVFDLEK